MKTILLILLCLCPWFIFAQTIPKDANIIVVKNVSFLEVCNTLLDSGYTIRKKDNELQTASTEDKEYPKLWNATYVINIRVKDSVLYISGTITAPPGGGLFKNEPISNQTNKKGITQQKSLFGYAFLVLNNFALGFKKDVSYLKK